MIRWYEHFFRQICIPFPRHYQATIASRHNETEAETQARHAQDSQGMYMHNVFAHDF